MVAALDHHSFEAGCAGGADGLDLGIALKCVVDDPAVEAVHGLEAHGLAGLADALREATEARDEFAALVGAITLDVDDDALGDLLAGVREAVDEELEVVEGVALPPDEAARVAGANLKHQAVVGLFLLDLEDEPQGSQDHLEDVPGGVHREKSVKPRRDVKRGGDSSKSQEPQPDRL